MKAQLADAGIRYQLVHQDQCWDVNASIGQSITLLFEGQISCVECQKSIKKAFGEGFCFNCFSDSANNSPCILRPELCEGHLGKGRDIEWELRNHVQEHVVYLALSSAVKVGVTRATQVPTRWIDQGASQAIVLARTPHRQLAGLIEVALKEHFTDKTSWQKMLKNEVSDEDLIRAKWMAADLLPRDWQHYITDDEDVQELHYPVLSYPAKVSSVGFDKQACIEGQLQGVKGQYLLLDQNRVINLRSHAGYHITVK
ncbi:MAG TPA: DUF2797 domain-containing protein [Luteibaculaceae bacterium]|nr:DUF2797 domain-containing protein [Luteibaculaceae bacterium]